jgi:hypothetical protein
MEKSELEVLVIKFVRDKNSLTQFEYEQISSSVNIDKSIQHLILTKRDVESQFVGAKAKMEDFFALCEQARRINHNVYVNVETATSDKNLPQICSFPPTEAYARFCAQINRWKLKNLRFLSLIETAIAALKVEKAQTLSNKQDESTPR